MIAGKAKRRLSFISFPAFRLPVILTKKLEPDCVVLRNFKIGVDKNDTDKEKIDG
jgi:hypothetical protein